MKLRRKILLGVIALLVLVPSVLLFVVATTETGPADGDAADGPHGHHHAHGKRGARHTGEGLLRRLGVDPEQVLPMS